MAVGIAAGARLRRWLKSLYRFPAATLNTGAAHNMRRLSALLEQSPGVKAIHIINVGGGSRFLGLDALSSELARQVINLDITALTGVDIVADAHALPFGNSSVHAIICQAVLEHVLAPMQVVAEFYRVLQLGGLVYAEIPFLQGYHRAPYDFRRYTLDGIQQLFSAFDRIDAGVCVGPSSTMSWVLRYYLAGLLSGFAEYSMWYKLALWWASWITFPIKYLDYLTASCQGSHVIAAGVYFLGAKRETG